MRADVPYARLASSASTPGFLLPRFRVVAADAPINDLADSSPSMDLWSCAFDDLIASRGEGAHPMWGASARSSDFMWVTVENARVAWPGIESLDRLMEAMNNNAAFPVIWCGEAEEGLHVGPLFRSMEDVAFYADALRACRVLNDIEALTGKREVPTSAAFWARHPRAVQDAVSDLMKSPTPERTAVLVENRSTKIIGIPKDVLPDALDHTARQFAWSKGFLYGADEVSQDEFGVHHAHALVPLIQPAELAVCSGKGSTGLDALVRMVGESVERLSAWVGGDSGLLTERPGGTELRADALHVERLADAPDTPTRFVDVRQMQDASDIRSIAAELVILGPFSFQRSFQSDTTGLAAHQTRPAAHQAALFECIERHNLYPGISHLAPAVQCTALSRHILGALDERSRSRRHAALDVRLLTFEERLYAPVVHCFVFDGRSGHWTRGTGSGQSMFQAGGNAFFEATQLMARLQNELASGREIAEEYAACIDNQAGRVLQAYCSRQHDASMAQFSSLPKSNDLPSALAAMRDDGHEAYVFDFPKVLDSWSACRVVVPGFARSQCRHGRVGERLIGSQLELKLPF